MKSLLPALLLLSGWSASAIWVCAVQEKTEPKPQRAPREQAAGVMSSGRTQSPAVSPAAIAAARRQAELLHASIHSTLQLVHDRYYREDEGLPIPAAILSEVFEELSRQQHVKLRWLVVEGQAMNTDHLPQDDFERAAVKALKAGRPFLDTVSGDTYLRAAPIRLSNHCLKCHVPDRRSTRDRTAGLIISIPTRGVFAESPARPSESH